MCIFPSMNWFICVIELSIHKTKLSDQNVKSLKFMDVENEIFVLLLHCLQNYIIPYHTKLYNDLFQII